MSEENTAPEEQQETQEQEETAPVEQEQGSKFDLSKLDPSLQKYIKGLRHEAANHRTTANQIQAQFEDLQERIKSVFGEQKEAVDPKLAVQELQQATQDLSFKNAVLETAVNHGIPASGIPYYEFLLNQAGNSLKEGEELSDEMMESILAEVKQKSGTQMMHSSVKSPQAAPSTKQDMDVNAFSKLGMAERTRLYQQNPQKYSELMDKWKKTIR